MLFHLFLVLEAEYLSGLQRRLEDSYYHLGNKTYSKKKQEIGTSAMVWYELLNSDFNFPTNPMMHLIFPLSVEQGTGQIKRSDTQGDVKEESPDCTLTSTNITVWNTFLNCYLNNSMAVVLLLFLPWEVEIGTGYFKRNMRQGGIKEKPPDLGTRQDELDNSPRRTKDGTSHQFPNLMSFKDVVNLVGTSPSNIQLKEEPPDLTNAVSFRGKSLNPHIVQRTNLLYLSVGEQVLRSKLFEEGGYDVDITSHDSDQLEPEETLPEAERTIQHPTDPTGEPRRNLTRGGKFWEDLGNPRRDLAAHGNFTRSLAQLANALFTFGGSYRDIEEGDHINPNTHGEPPGDISATLGNVSLLMAAHGNIIRRLIKAFLGPTEAVEDLPYLAKLKGYLAIITSGITKEITANSQDPNQTTNHSGPAYWSYEGITLENYHSPHLPPPTLFGRCHLFTPSFTTLCSPLAQRVISYHIHHQTPSFITTYLYSPHHIYFTNSPHFTNGYHIKAIHLFPYFQLIIINHDFLSIRSSLQRLYFSNKGTKFRSNHPNGS